jgi:hypothetical protein
MESILPRSLGKLKKHECADLLNQALYASPIQNKAELSKLTGIPFTTLSSYFSGKHRPSQQNWNLMREYFCPEAELAEKGAISKDESGDIVHRAERVKAHVFLLWDELLFFKDQSAEARKILKENLDMEKTGHAITLFKALFSEEELDIWKAF